MEPVLQPDPPERAKPDSQAAVRIIDANANRIAEGLRVVEEFARFVLDDAYLTGMCKDLRHGIDRALAVVPLIQRSQARNTIGDVGTEITGQHESHRASTWHVAVASLQRIKQGLRVVEEYAKQSWPQLASECEQFRYSTYTLEKCLTITHTSCQQLEAARLYVLIDGLGAMEADEPTRQKQFALRAASLVAAGVHVLQLRDKTLDDRQLLQRAHLLRDITSGSATRFIMNDRPDLARLARADGVHVGQEELPVADARAILSSGQIVGVSTHNIDQLRQAVLDGADYVGCGPVFSSNTKQFSALAGLEFLRAAQSLTRLPAFAIGGIRLDNLDQILALGWRRVAVRDAVWNAPEPDRAARDFLAALNQ